MRVLVIDDDPKIRTFVSRGLTESGYTCAVAEDGETAIRALRDGVYDLALLDVMLPDMTGWQVMDVIRAEKIDIGVIFVTARDEVDERVRGLRMGGDDYVVKPFAFAELVARMQVALRHRSQRTRVRVADLEVDFLKSEVRRDGARIDLTPTEYQLLKLLIEHHGEVVPRTQLLQDVWGHDFDSGTNIVEVQIRRLRRKVDEPFDDALIHTVRGAGYVLEAR